MEVLNNPLRDLILLLLNGDLRKATVSRADAADEVALLDPSVRRIIDNWLGIGRGNSASRKVLRDFLDINFPI